MDESLRAHAQAAQRAIRAGHLRGAAFRDALLSVPASERDVWVDEALGLDAPPDDVPGLPAGTVPYLPCGVDAILRTVLDAPVAKNDVFVDLGAGLGRVAILVHLLTGARALGVEFQSPLVERACSVIEKLRAPKVEVLLGDAAGAGLSEGTVFFIYASFSPPVLRRVLGRLEQIALHRSIVLCAVGFDVLGQPWLTARPSLSPELLLYDARPPSPTHPT